MVAAAAADAAAATAILLLMPETGGNVGERDRSAIAELTLTMLPRRPLPVAVAVVAVES
jgi:hypothetical protein